MHHIDYGFSIIDRDQVMPLIAEGKAVDLADVYGVLSAERRVVGSRCPSGSTRSGPPRGSPSWRSCSRA